MQQGQAAGGGSETVRVSAGTKILLHFVSELWVCADGPRLEASSHFHLSPTSAASHDALCISKEEALLALCLQPPVKYSFSARNEDTFAHYVCSEEDDTRRVSWEGGGDS